jgi:hypothetical protein
MKWTKRGLIYVPESNGDWRISHAQLPVVDRVDDDVLRIYFGTRDAEQRTVTTYIEVEADRPENVLYIHEEPVLGLGGLGCFDDSGAMPSWIVNHGGIKYFYYIGWNAGVSVGYRNSIGLAISDDNGRTFTRLFKGPVMDRTRAEPHFCGTPCIIIENGTWRMWYLSTIRWTVVGGKPEPIYNIRYAESADGIEWNRPGTVCIDLKSAKEGGLARPCVLNEDGLYRMWFSYRGVRGYRTDRERSYRIGYAESEDGLSWHRKDDEVGINVSSEGWDSFMIAYAHVIEHRGKKYMFYNGNGFGQSGIGYAILEEAA